MWVALKPERFLRYKDVARLLWKYGRSDLVRRAGLEDAIDAPSSPQAVRTESALARELANDLEALGPTFIKLGQVLSTRPDLVPLAYVEALSRLQDRVEPFPFSEVEEVVSSELGVRISKAFASFDPVPVAAASLGQTHRATLRDGRTVAVKVQRPKIREQLMSDLEMLEEVSVLLDRHTDAGKRYGFTGLVREFRASLLRELDYQQEARNLTALSANLEAFPRLVVPLPVPDYTSSRVLTMDFVHGRKIASLSPLSRLDLDGDELANELFRAYLHQVLVDGFFHADPHPGNLFLTDDGRIALLDLGMVGRVTPEMQENLLQLLLSLVEGRTDDAERTLRGLGTVDDDFDEEELRRGIVEFAAQFQDASLGNIAVGKVFLGLVRAAGEGGLHLPSELTLLGKTLLHLDHVATTLAPDFRPNEVIRREAAELTRRRIGTSLSFGRFLNVLLESKAFLEKLPKRANDILELASRNELKLNVRAIDERVLVEGFQKMANRIATGLVLASLIVGASMLMQIETTFRLWGYPGFAMICFLGAALGGVSLLVSILRSDRHG